MSAGAHRHGGGLRLAAAAVLLLVAGPAAAFFGAHFEGQDARGHSFRFYVDGGAFLGSQGQRHEVEVTLRIGSTRPGSEAAQGETAAALPVRCRYSYLPQGAGPVRLACVRAGAVTGAAVSTAAKAAERLVGVAWAPVPGGPPEVLHCVQQCRSGVPRLLTMEVEEDNH